jgi:hypothetical protein
MRALCSLFSANLRPPGVAEDLSEAAALLWAFSASKWYLLIDKSKSQQQERVMEQEG